MTCALHIKAARATTDQPMTQHPIVQHCPKSKINMMQRWKSMWERCYKSDSSMYEYYGARGIRVCQEWMDFRVFYDFWGDPPFDGATIGRINNDGNYEPSNCEWQTQEQQNNNTRRSRLITFNGKTQSIRDWAEEYNIGTRRLWERLNRGWDMQRAVTTPCPKGFQAELNERREQRKQEWQIKGHLYSARSRWRRSQSLSPATQDLLAVEGVEPTKEAQAKKTKIKNVYADRQNLKEVISKMKQEGMTIRRISHELNIPKSTVHYYIHSDF